MTRRSRRTGQTFRLRLDGADYRTLLSAAGERNLEPDLLLALIMHAVLQDDLIKAVLDDQSVADVSSQGGSASAAMAG